MGIVIIVAILLTFVALGLFVRTKGLVDKIPADDDPARGNPKLDFTLAIIAAAAAAVAWIAALILS